MNNIKGEIANYEYELTDSGFYIGEFTTDVSLTRDEAIALAITILSHFGEKNDS